MGIVSGYLILSIEILIKKYFCRILVHMFDELIGIVDMGGRTARRCDELSQRDEYFSSWLPCPWKA